jgi:hypothetical protein
MNWIEKSLGITLAFAIGGYIGGTLAIILVAVTWEWSR